MITGFIGAGRVGVSLGKYLSDAGVPLAGYYDLSAEAATSAAEFTNSRCFDSPDAKLSATAAAHCRPMFLMESGTPMLLAAPCIRCCLLAAGLLLMRC